MTEDPTLIYLGMYDAMRAGDLPLARRLARVLEEMLLAGTYPPNYCPVEVRAYVASVLRRTAGVAVVNASDIRLAGNGPDGDCER